MILGGEKEDARRQREKPKQQRRERELKRNKASRPPEGEVILRDGHQPKTRHVSRKGGFRVGSSPTPKREQLVELFGKKDQLKKSRLPTARGTSSSPGGTVTGAGKKGISTLRCEEKRGGVLGKKKSSEIVEGRTERGGNPARPIQKWSKTKTSRRSRAGTRPQGVSTEGGQKIQVPTTTRSV